MGEREQMRDNRTVAVLGETYWIWFDDVTETDRYGDCDRYAKEINIYLKTFDNEDSCKCIDKVIDKTVRHELIHAIFHEAGLDEYAEDETLVDCLAILYPKIEKIMESVSK